MRFATFLVTILGLLTSLQGHSAERTFRVFESKRITPLVDRFYGQDGNAFGTVFCNPQAAQVMFVDSRVGDLDGKTFYFESVEACDKGRTQARQLSQKCVVELVLDQETQGAQVRLSQCLGN